MVGQKKWYETWFDSKYYHILYKNRDDLEAQHFIDKIVSQFNIKENSRVLDLACGKGRHAYYLAQKGLDVVGLDLSENSIEYALENYKQENLDFAVHDMRNPSRINYYDYVFNLFTSIGYFDSVKENEKVFNSVHLGLKNEGYFLLDFFNATKTLENLVEQEEKTIDGITFHISRNVENRKIIKRIRFEADNRTYNFNEEVQLLYPSDFEKLIEKTGFTIINQFGNYQLDKFDTMSSDRFIFLAKKRK